MKVFKSFIVPVLLLGSVLCSAKPKELHVVSTGDTHGAWFPLEYSSLDPVSGLMSVNAVVDSLRAAVGEDNVLLLDAGDFLQGDCAPYYYNCVSTDTLHLYPRLAKYMRYDAVVPGNHDIETGHAVYDRVHRNLSSLGIPMLCSNVFASDGSYYFEPRAIFRKAGMKVAVLGFTNPNVAAWLGPELWSGLTFESLLPRVQTEVDKVRSEEHPDIVIVVIHSGVGKGDGSEYENQGFDLQNTLKGVDLLICGHDHRPLVSTPDGLCALVDGGSKGKFLTHSIITANRCCKKQKNKDYNINVISVNKNVIDTVFFNYFKDEYDSVRNFNLTRVGRLEVDLRTRDAYKGMSSYVNLLHRFQLEFSGAQISFAAPLTFDGKVDSGDLRYRDLLTVYPFENQLFAINLTGAEIRKYLELSYDRWVGPSDGHILRISNSPDQRTSSPRWSFTGRPYNFDSAAGINYTVNPFNPFGSRVEILSMADGSAFSEDAFYRVALTSYRANGGGGLIPASTGLKADELQSRDLTKLPEIRVLIYEYLKQNPILDSAFINDYSRIGEWKFVPEEVGASIEKDLNLIF